MERILEGEAIFGLAQARRYNQVMGRGLVSHEYRGLAVKVVALGVPVGGRVLDVGTGPGFVALELAARLGDEVRVVGLDLSEAMLAVAAENARLRGLDNLVTWRLGDAKAMPFGDNEFDFVVSSGSLHHWENPLAVMSEVDRVLKPGGRFIIQDLKRLQTWPPRLFAWAVGLAIPRDFRRHFWSSIRAAYTPDELRQMLENSPLQNWRVDEDFMGLAVVREN